MEIEYSKAFDFDRTRLSYTVNPLNESAEPLKSLPSMPSHLFVIIRHSLRSSLYVSLGNGDFHSAEENQSVNKLKAIAVDSSLFSFKDDLVHHSVHRALSSVSVDPILWEAISDAVMVEGGRMVKCNLEAYDGWNSKRIINPTTCMVNDTLVVDVLTDHRFVCYEDVGES